MTMQNSYLWWPECGKEGASNSWSCKCIMYKVFRYCCHRSYWRQQWGQSSFLLIKMTSRSGQRFMRLYLINFAIRPCCRYSWSRKGNHRGIWEKDIQVKCNYQADNLGVHDGKCHTVKGMKKILIDKNVEENGSDDVKLTKKKFLKDDKVRLKTLV